MQGPRIGPWDVVYEDQHQRILRVTADFGAFEKEYFVRDSGQRAGIVVTRGEDVLLVRQYRLLVDQVSWELPGGHVEDGEDPAAAARRECAEEAGIVCGELAPLLLYHPGLDTSYNPTHLFHGEAVGTTASSQSEHEVHEHVWVPAERCLQMVRSGEIVDALTIVGLLAYHTR